MGALDHVGGSSERKGLLYFNPTLYLPFPFMHRDMYKCDSQKRKRLRPRGHDYLEKIRKIVAEFQEQHEIDGPLLGEFSMLLTYNPRTNCTGSNIGELSGTIMHCLEVADFYRTTRQIRALSCDYDFKAGKKGQVKAVLYPIIDS